MVQRKDMVPGLEARVVLAALLFAAAGVAGCELVVGDGALDVVKCSQEGAGPPACAQGQVCSGGVCIARSEVPNDGGTDTSVEPDADTGVPDGPPPEVSVDGDVTIPPDGPLPDVPTEAPPPDSPPPDVVHEAPPDSPPDVVNEPPPPPAAYGEPCTGHSGCQSGYCHLVPGSSALRCSSMCCGSTSCPSDSVCMPYATGGACFRASELGLSIGSGAAGSSCQATDACRSGRCVGDICQDVCCATGGACHCEVMAGGWQCGTGTGTGGEGAACNGGSECNSAYCMPVLKYCVGPCCKDSDCSGLDVCAYVVIGGAPVRQCVFVAPTSTLSCCTNADCTGGKKCVYAQDEAWSVISISTTTVNALFCK